MNATLARLTDNDYGYAHHQYTGRGTGGGDEMPYPPPIVREEYRVLEVMTQGHPDRIKLLFGEK